MTPSGGEASPDDDATVTVAAGTPGPSGDPTVAVPPATTVWAAPQPPGPYGPGGWPAATWAPPGQGPPPYGPYGPPPGGTAVWPGAAPEPIRRRNGKPLAIIGVVVLLAVVAGVAFLVIPPGAATAVGNAAADVRGWAGATYRGPVRGSGGASVTVDLTVAPNGDKSGTLTKAGGGRAEFVETGGVQLLRGNPAWWSGTPQGTDKSRRLAGAWLRNPAPETTWLAPLPLLSPAALADALAPVNGPAPGYDDAGDQQVDGVEGRVVAAPDRRAVLADDRQTRLLALVPPEATDPAGLRVAPAAPDRLAAIGSDRSAAASAVDYSAALYEPVDVEVEILPAPRCTTPTCTVAVLLRNTGGLEARGAVSITKNGALLNRYPFTLGPRANATFTSTSPNAGIAAGRDVTASYEAAVTAS